MIRDHDPTIPPLLVLGLGNPLLGDDGAGQRLLDSLEPQYAREAPTIEFVDGGTQGLKLLGLFAGRRAVLILDAVGLGSPPGTVHVLSGAEAIRMAARPAHTAHEGGAGALLAAAALLGELPREVVVVGIEPERVQTGIGLSPAVEFALTRAAAEARRRIAGLLGPVPRLEAAHA
jgi:hydrogenase maturation protease